MNVTIIGNFNVIDDAMSPNFQHTGKWYDFFSGDSIEVTDINEGVFLKAGEFHIYSDEKLPTPEDDIITSIETFDTLCHIIAEPSQLNELSSEEFPAMNWK